MLQALILALAMFQTPDSKLMIDAAKKVPVKSVTTGEYHEKLQEIAQEYAEQMAAQCRQDGHAGWDRRTSRLRSRLPQYTYQEITAESWSWQDNRASSHEMFHCWRQSPGHWSVANGPANVYGYAMARGRNKIFYGVGIIGRRR